jgi:DNA-binding transcriptional regulator LsrR (DeoR family)
MQKLYVANRGLQARSESRSDIVTAHGLKDPRMVERYIKELLNDDTLRIVINKFPVEDSTVRDSDLEQQLKVALPISNAVVIKVERPPDSDTSSPDFALYSDYVHFRLGQHMGASIPLWIGAGDTIGLSSGRGVRYSINAIKQQLGAPDVTLLSLTGSLEMRAHAINSVIMDGDLNVAALATRFHKVRCRMAACSITDEYAKPWFLEHGAPMPDKGLVGVGVLEGQNRFLCRQPQDRRHPVLDPVKHDFDHLEGLIKSAKGYPCCVGEIANCLFWIESRGKGQGDLPREQIQATIARINQRLRRVDLLDLKRIRSLYVVAGTEQKAHALRAVAELLGQIHTLVTDVHAAARMLSP